MAPDKQRVTSGGSDARSGPGQPGGSGDKKSNPENDDKITPQLLGKRMDLPPEAYRKDSSGLGFTKRPGDNTEGKSLEVLSNIYQVTKLPAADTTIYQYSISASPNEKNSKTLLKKLWDTPRSRSGWQGSPSMGTCIVGSTMARPWHGHSTSCPGGERSISVILPDQKKQKKTSKGPSGSGSGSGSAAEQEGPKPFTFLVMQAWSFKLDDLIGYLTNKENATWKEGMTQKYNFLDHLLRQGPSSRLTPIRRSFYGKVIHRLGTHTRAIPGIYAAFRPMNTKTNIRLCVNVDVTHTAFWHTDSTLCDAGVDMIVDSDLGIPKDQVVQRLRPVVRNGKVCMSDAFQILRRLERAKFTINHGGSDKNRVYTVDRIFFDARTYPNGADSTNVTFKKKQEDGSERSVTVKGHFDSLNINLEHPNFPLIKTRPGAYFPMELCKFAPKQRYPFKLSPDETSAMIGVAGGRPKDRKKTINTSVGDLKWSDDPYLKQFGVTINGGNTHMFRTPALMLPAPALEFNRPHRMNNHRWMLTNVKFFDGKPLASWVVFSLDSNRTKGDIDTFLTKFKEVYGKHAGTASSPKGAMIKLAQLSELDEQRVIKEYSDLVKTTANPFQIAFFLLPKRSPKVYNIVKKVMDCTFKVPSQVLVWEKIDAQNQRDARAWRDQGRKTDNAISQYCSNISLKVNAKLGGINCYVRKEGVKHTPSSSAYYQAKTMFIGLDVSHAPAGTNEPSMAALTVSVDRLATRYGAACQTNGIRTEIMEEATMKALLPRFIQQWRVGHNTLNMGKSGGPEHVYFFRDGVDTGQFESVISKEVKAILETFTQEALDQPKITVVIVTKRHHVRFFRSDAKDVTNFDTHENPKPGLLVQEGATHPDDWDFFLTSHNAIQGTSRPIHYQVILNEIGCTSHDLQRMIFHHCYQYCRATLPVSMHPAVFYAHLASKRAQAHQRPPAPPPEPGKVPDVPLLFPMRADNLPRTQTSAIEKVMWFV
ncbi:eukaryotic translation initiation factor 2c [Apiospora hydei]|uniref:Eukaryotic translation initiation factor 2c n=1 Tax=Apiospora hydei TaxID=1337664 RepID=A0ABR1W839_9PEZI